MNPTLREFLDLLLVRNPVFMVFIGTLLAAVEARSARGSLLPALRFAVVLAGAAFIGGVLASRVPGFAQLLVLAAIAVAGTAILWAWGELRGQWLGLPKAILAAAPLAGAQLLALEAGSLGSAAAGAAGSAVGFAWAFIVLGSIREFSSLTETGAAFKTYPVVLLSMGIFSLVLTGFLFW